MHGRLFVSIVLVRGQVEGFCGTDHNNFDETFSLDERLYTREFGDMRFLLRIGVGLYFFFGTEIS